MILLMQFLKAQGPFCRDCGIAVFRTMTSRTFVQGWWGFFSFFITPIILLINFSLVPSVRRLPAPMPHPDGRSVQPMPMGKPLYLRPTIAGLLVPLALFGLFVVSIFTGGPQTLVGQCVAANPQVHMVSCEQPNQGTVISVADDKDSCPADATGWVEDYTPARGKVLCVR